jgi:hypothetical protein
MFPPRPGKVRGSQAWLRSAILPGVSRLSLLLLSSLALAACMTPPPPQEARSPGEAPPATDPGSPFGPGATLQGPIAKVDGEYAPNTGRAFEVTPGCHVVRSNTSDAVENPDVKISIQMQAVDFAVPVQEGYHYVLVREFTDTSGPTGRFTIHVREEDATGQLMRLIPPAQNEAELKECLERD